MSNGHTSKTFCPAGLAHMGCPAVNLACLSMLHSIAAVLRYLGVIRLRGYPQNHLKGLTMRRMQAILINASAEATLTS